MPKKLGTKGTTLVEILAAITVFLLFASAAAFCLISESESARAARIRSEALSLAVGAIEKVRSMSYDDIGTAGGNPAGKIPAVENVSVGNVSYTVKTDVTWVDDPRDGKGSGDSNPHDYKRVAVTVTASPFPGRAPITVSFATLVSQERGAD